MRALSVALFIVGFAGLSLAQTPGEWKYTISTDPTSVPEDMRVNFPTVSFTVCRSAEDFASGQAFALQTLASSEARCPSASFERTTDTAKKVQSFRFDFACDSGKTLAGSARGTASTRSFAVQLESRYSPPVSGVASVKQTMRGDYVGPCKAKKDADEIKVE
jgi:Protein of unknown function (DUF3617)